MVSSVVLTDFSIALVLCQVSGKLNLRSQARRSTRSAWAVLRPDWSALRPDWSAYASCARQPDDGGRWGRFESSLQGWRPRGAGGLAGLAGEWGPGREWVGPGSD